MTFDQRILVQVGGRRREFLLHRPAGPGPLPLVVMFHGTGGSAAWAADETGWSDIADREMFAVAYPEGLPPDPGKPAKFLTNPQLWHDGSHDDRPAQDADRDFIAAMLDLLVNDYGIDPRRISVTGFSNGAGMTFALATWLAQRFAACAPVAGHCWLEHPRPFRPVPTLYLVGDEDPLIPLAGGLVRSPWGKTRVKPGVAETLRRWAVALGCSTARVILEETATTILEEYPHLNWPGLFLAMTIRGLGHHWPGGKGKLSEKIGGRPSAAVNGCERIWEFFRRHQLEA
jgi:polyhydroxybutyrate depolymerase